MVKQTNVSFESRYLRMLNNIAKIMATETFGFENKIDESYLADVLSSKSISDIKKISVSINECGWQLIIFGEEACNFNDITYSGFKNIFNGIVIKDLNIEKYLKEETKFGKLYLHKLSRIIGKTLLDELSDLNSDNDLSNHQTFTLLENLTPGVALLMYANLIKIGSRYDNYNDIEDGISEDDIFEGICRDLKLCKFLFENLTEYFSEDVFIERVASAISEYISDEKTTYSDINHFCIEEFDDSSFGTENVFETIISYFGKGIFLKAIEHLLKGEQQNLKTDDYDYLKIGELKTQFSFARTILKLLKDDEDDELDKSQKEILLEELMLIFFNKDDHSAYILRNKWRELFDISKEDSRLPFYLEDFKKNFQETFSGLLDYLKENNISDKHLIINAPTYTGLDFDIAYIDQSDDSEKFYPFVKNYLHFFDFLIETITERECEGFINIMTQSYNDEFIHLEECSDSSLLFESEEYRVVLNLALYIFSKVSDKFDEGSKEVLNNLINSSNYRLSQIDSK
jgi:hypothetical protein